MRSSNFSKNPKYTKADGTIKEHISNLKQEGKLKIVGSTKSGCWKVLGYE